MILTYKKILIGVASYYVLAPITCNITMIPLCIMTNSYCKDEGGNIIRNGVLLRGKRLTPFEKIVRGQGVWLWGLMGWPLMPFICPTFYLSIIRDTMSAIPLSFHHLYVMKYNFDYYDALIES